MNTWTALFHDGSALTVDELVAISVDPAAGDSRAAEVADDLTARLRTGALFSAANVTGRWNPALTRLYLADYLPESIDGPELPAEFTAPPPEGTDY